MLGDYLSPNYYKAMNVREELIKLSDEKMADFSYKLNPTLEREMFLGIKTPVLRDLAKKLSKADELNDYLDSLPHKYFEEYQLHGLALSLVKDFDECIKRLEAFLPYMDNWAVCDQTSPKCFKKNKEKLMPYIEKWIKADEPFTVRFSVNMLMQHFLDDDFKPEYLDMVAKIKSEHYYVQMVMAWYFATALAKQYDYAVKLIENNVLDKWVHNKTIQKSIESFRVTDKHKKYLRSLKIK